MDPLVAAAIFAERDDDVKFVPIKVDPDSKSLRVNLWVWNPLASPNPAWERMKQPIIELTGDLTVTLGDVEKLLAGHYYKDALYEYSGGNLIYKGLSTTHKASQSTGNLWWIWKYTWTSGDLVRTEGPLNDDWDDRAGLAWA